MSNGKKQKFNPEKWANQVWKKSVKNWIKRSNQDYNYRDYLVQPALKKFFKKNRKYLSNDIWIDFGCGEGRETFMLSKIFKSMKISNHIIGLDSQPKLIEKARESFSKYSIKFFSKTLNTFFNICKEKINGVSFLFVLQDTPKAKQILKLTSKSLFKNNLIVIIIVHPNFAKKLKENNLIKIKKVSNNKNWEWCGEYPIAETNKKPFYVPYFHRSVGWYIDALEKNGMKILYNKNLKPNTTLLKKATVKRLSPFYKYSNNIYWPYIEETPSSLLLVAQKKKIV